MTRKQFINTISRAVLALQAALATTAVAAPDGAPPGLFNTANPRVQAAVAVQRGVTPGLMSVAGILGSLININGEQYILSNYHVFESDIVPGGNSRVAEDGSPVIQPGLIDVGCNLNNAQTVATLVVKQSLPNSNVDVGIAKVTSGMVDPTGAILEIGTISGQTVVASLNQLVKKSGRTTGLTRSKVVGLNATVSITYDNECAGGTAFTKTFSGQILIDNQLAKAKKFIAGGDSGSLMVEDVTTNPHAVGLLYAGSNTYAIANPIDEVLSFFGATMVGQ